MLNSEIKVSLEISEYRIRELINEQVTERAKELIKEKMDEKIKDVEVDSATVARAILKMQYDQDSELMKLLSSKLDKVIEQITDEELKTILLQHFVNRTNHC